MASTKTAADVSQAKIYMPLDQLEKNVGLTNIDDILRIKSDEILSGVHLEEDLTQKKISFGIKNNIFMKDVLSNINKPDTLAIRKKVIVEFSSPNIAKPFHVGHLRSTIIGNFLSNLNKFLGNEVTRLNYLGDWGTQFGFLKVGLDLENLTDEAIKLRPLETLYDAYVKANKLAENDPEIINKARSVFSSMEKGDEKELKVWKRLTKYSKLELRHIYTRLGIMFDEYHFESMYSAKDIQDVIAVLEQRNTLMNKDGKKVATVNDKEIPLVKSDGTMLYLTRDIAAAIDRYEKRKFDEMLYVVDGSQCDHFNNMMDILHHMDFPWADRLRHVKFGRIIGMSTRRGNAVFLKDILDEAHDLMKQNQVKSLSRYFFSFFHF